nr:hypothetical protein [uncultured Draconibacterium sp.]
MDINIFKYAPKELSTDAFLNYLFKWSEQNNCLNEVADSLLLIEGDKGKNVHKLKVKRQVSFGRKKADIVVDFILDGEPQSVLFENKTRSTTSRKQLNNYKPKNKNKKYSYKYLKLGYINNVEREICRKCGYDIIDSNSLYNLLKRLTIKDEIIQQYISYLHDEFISEFMQIEVSFSKNEMVKVLDKKDAQAYLADRLSDTFGRFEFEKSKLSSSEINYHIQYGSNAGGQPWTELVFLEGEDYPDAFFWRIDKRNGKHYIRLNQYSNSKKFSHEEKLEKTSRLSDLRRFSKDYFDKIIDLSQGRLIDKAENEREVLIFFLSENNMSRLLEEIPAFSLKLQEYYGNRWGIK